METHVMLWSLQMRSMASRERPAWKGMAADRALRLWRCSA